MSFINQVRNTMSQIEYGFNLPTCIVAVPVVGLLALKINVLDYFSKIDKDFRSDASYVKMCEFSDKAVKKIDAIVIPHIVGGLIQIAFIVALATVNPFFLIGSIFGLVQITGALAFAGVARWVLIIFENQSLATESREIYDYEYDEALLD